LSQLNDWSSWFSENRNYVRRYFPFTKEMAEFGLSEPSLMLIIDRHATLTDQTKMRMERMMAMQGVTIMSYDTLLQRCHPPRIKSPDRPLKMCRFAQGGIEEISSVIVDPFKLSW
jgi:hypothetical protein